jgi:hypothetical protein
MYVQVQFVYQPASNFNRVSHRLKQAQLAALTHVKSATTAVQPSSRVDTPMKQTIHDFGTKTTQALLRAAAG